MDYVVYGQLPSHIVLSVYVENDYLYQFLGIILLVQFSSIFLIFHVNCNCRCAFKNTPKYNQVHGKGKIVKKDWIERCHALRKRLSWRKFALDLNDAEQTDSEGEIVDIAKKPSGSSPSKRAAERPSSKTEEQVRETDEEALAHYDLDDVVMVEERIEDTVEVSGSDTEEEIERVKQMQKKTAEQPNAMYDKSTEDEGNQSMADAFAPLDFFKGKAFFIDSDVGAVDIIKLERYIKLYKG